MHIATSSEDSTIMHHKGIT